jgi:hypothetical protein
MYTLRSLRSLRAPRVADSKKTEIMNRLRERAQSLGMLNIRAKATVVRKLAF